MTGNRFFIGKDGLREPQSTITEPNGEVTRTVILPKDGLREPQSTRIIEGWTSRASAHENY